MLVNLLKSNKNKEKIILSPNIDKNNKFGWFILVFILTPFVLNILNQIGQKYPLNQINLFLQNIVFFSFQNNLPKTIDGQILGKSFSFFFFFILPFLITTVVELSGNGKLSFADTSIAKIKNSIGHKYADLWYFLFAILISEIPFLVIFVTFGYSLFIKGTQSGLFPFFENIYDFIIPFQTNELTASLLIILASLISDFMAYSAHYIHHRFQFLWDIHELHHSATEMTILSKFRQSPIEDINLIFITLPINIIYAVLLTKNLQDGLIFPFLLFILDRVVKDYQDWFAHSSYKIIYPKPISYILMSPALHWIHHSDNPKHFNKNFSTRYSIWDRLFGTYLDESHLVEVKGFGVKNTRYNKYHPLYSYVCLPIVLMIKRLKNSGILVK